MYVAPSPTPIGRRRASLRCVPQRDRLAFNSGPDKAAPVSPGPQLSAARIRSVGRADVGIIAATNRDLEQAVKENAFRRDLYFRINVLRLYMVPLRHKAIKDVREARGITLLREWLPPMQRAQFDASKSFDVVGYDSGRRYRILYGKVTNVMRSKAAATGRGGAGIRNQGGCAFHFFACCANADKSLCVRSWRRV
jgi:hypothetical protein